MRKGDVELSSFTTNNFLKKYFLFALIQNRREIKQELIILLGEGSERRQGLENDWMGIGKGHGEILGCG
jgi:hypothetical protein